MLADHSNTPFGLRDWRIEDACRSLKHAIGLKDWRIIVSFAINLRGSNELNPFLAGPFRRTHKFPCLPWKKGSWRSPEGNVCRACAYGHVIGGFKDQHGSLDECFEKCKRSETMIDEWKATIEELITLTNKRQIKIRMRGYKKANLMKSIQDLRKKTVEVIKQSGMSVKEKFWAITLVKWMERNNQQDPKALGHVRV
jgi:hypothetical protein